jgi:hypothetical protein
VQALPRYRHALYPIFVHQLDALALCFFQMLSHDYTLALSDPSDSSSWVTDLHRQRFRHARHTRLKAAVGEAVANPSGFSCYARGFQETFPVTSRIALYAKAIYMGEGT